MEIIYRAIPLCNVYVIRTDNGSILVDAGCYRNKTGLLAEFIQMGVDPKEIKLIVLTHGHFDHAGNMSVAKELTHAPVICHVDAAKYLADGTRPEYCPRGEWGVMFAQGIADSPEDVPHGVEAEITFEEEYDLHPLGYPGKLVHTPGHCASSVSLIMDSGEAFVGDTIIANPFEDGHAVAALLADDIGALKKSMKVLTESAKVFYTGHADGPLDLADVIRAKEMLEG